MLRRKLLLAFIVLFCMLWVSSLTVVAAPSLDIADIYAQGLAVLIYTCPAGENADVVVQRNGANLEILNQGAVVATRPASTTLAVVVDGPESESAWLTVDYAGGRIGRSVSFTGSDHGANHIGLRGGQAGEIVYSPLDASTGSITVDNATISYVNVAYIVVAAPADTFGIVQPAYLAGPINVVDGPMVDGIATTEINSGSSNGFAPVRLANQTDVAIFGNAATNTYTLSNPHPGVGLQFLTINATDLGNDFAVYTTVAGGTTTLNTGGGHDVVNVYTTTAEGPLFVNGQAGDDAVTISQAGSVQGILGEVTVGNADGLTDLTVDDMNDPAGRTAVMTGSSIVGLAPAAIRYEPHIHALVVHGGAGGNTFTVAGTVSGAPTILNTGLGDDRVNVLATSPAGPLTVNGQAGSDTAVVGDAGSVQEILGAVTIGNAAGATALMVDDSRDPSPRTATISGTEITGLAPAVIHYIAHVRDLIVHGGTGGNTFDVIGTIPDTTVSLNAGSGDDLVNVLQTTAHGHLIVNGQAGHDAVLIGQAGSVQSIFGEVTVGNAEGATDLTVDDSADGTARTVTITGNAIVGLAPANLHYVPNIHELVVHGGPAGNTITIADTFSDGMMTVNAGLGNDQITIVKTAPRSSLTVHGQAGADTALISDAGSVQGIQGEVFVDNADGTIAVTVNDANDATGRRALVSQDTIANLAPAFMHYLANTSELVILGGSGGNFFTILSTISGAPMILNAGVGNDTVNVAGTSVDGPLAVNGQAGTDTVGVGDYGNSQHILGNVTVGNAGGKTDLTVDDSEDANPRATTLTATQITGLTPAVVSWTAVINTLTIKGAKDINTIVVASTPAHVATTIHGGPADDAISVYSTAATGTLAIHGMGGMDQVAIGEAGSVQAILGPVSIANSLGQLTVIMDDSADTTARTVTISDQQVVGLAPATISYAPADMGALAIHAGSGGNTVTIASTPAACAVMVRSGAGNDHVTVQTTAPDSSLGVDGGGGVDAVVITNGGSVQGILGDVAVLTLSDGQISLRVDDSADTEARTAAITEITITGLAPATIAMGPMTSVTILAGQGSDTLNLVPSANVPFIIEGNNPTPPALPGDTLEISLEGVETPVLTVTKYDATGYRGAWTFANRQSVSFGTVETLKPTAALVMNKTASVESVITGDNMQYTLTVAQGGPNDAENVVVSDNLPPNVRFESLVAPEGWACVTPAIGSSGLVECSKPVVAVGEDSVFVITVNAFSWPLGGDMPNTATVTSTTADPDPSNNTDTVTVRVLPRLAITIGAQRDTLPPTWIARFTITVTNESQSLLPEITVTDPLPDPTLFVRALDGGQLVDGVVTWRLTDVPAGAIRVLHVEMWTNSTFHGIIDNWATAAAYGFSIRANKVVRITP